MITHKVVQSIVFSQGPMLIVSDRGAWEDFNSANRQAIECAESLKQSGSLEVHEIIAGTADTKRIVLRYVVEYTETPGPHVLPIRTRKQRIEIPPP